MVHIDASSSVVLAWRAWLCVPAFSLATRNDEHGLAVLQYRANAARLCLEPGGCRTADLGADRVEVF